MSSAVFILDRSSVSPFDCVRAYCPCDVPPAPMTPPARRALTIAATRARDRGDASRSAAAGGTPRRGTAGRAAGAADRPSRARAARESARASALLLARSLTLLLGGGVVY